MTKSELANRLHERFPDYTFRDIDLMVDNILGAMRDSLVRQDRIEIRGFGSFTISYRKPRIGRNPKTGQQVSVPGKPMPRFRAGKVLLAKVNL